MISIICVFNNRAILEEYLLSSLKIQDTEYELILIDNSEGNYESAASALNIGGQSAEGDYLMFVHQDMRLCSPDWLRCASEILMNLPDLGIAGVAGKATRAGVVTCMTHGSPPHPAGLMELEDSMQVQTLDECLALIPRSVYNLLKFDEWVCRGWHLYIVDYCMSIVELGLRSYVIPLKSHHGSAGFSMSQSYFHTLPLILKKHRSKTRWIMTTMGDWNTRIPLFLQRTVRFARSGRYIKRYMNH